MIKHFEVQLKDNKIPCWIENDFTFKAGASKAFSGKKLLDALAVFIDNYPMTEVSNVVDTINKRFQQNFESTTGQWIKFKGIELSDFSQRPALRLFITFSGNIVVIKTMNKGVEYLHLVLSQDKTQEEITDFITKTVNEFLPAEKAVAVLNTLGINTDIILE